MNKVDIISSAYIQLKNALAKAEASGKETRIAKAKKELADYEALFKKSNELNTRHG